MALLDLDADVNFGKVLRYYTYYPSPRSERINRYLGFAVAEIFHIITYLRLTACNVDLGSSSISPLPLPRKIQPLSSPLRQSYKGVTLWKDRSHLVEPQRRVTRRLYKVWY